MTAAGTREHDGGVLDLGGARPRRGVSGRLLRLASDERLVEHVRAGSEPAFEVLFDRYHRGVLGFCRHMLGSVEEAEDAVQHTFLAAFRELVGSGKPVQLRPWLYTIARNRCLTLLRTRQRQAAGELQDPPTEHLAAEVERRQELRHLLRDVAGLPEDQRAALVLSELGDMSHDEIADVLGCRREKVKALVFQARSSLIASRTAREIPCGEIREQVANLRGGSLRRNDLRRHLSECAGCREFRDHVRAQRRDLALVLPVAPSVGLKSAVVGAVLGGSAASAPAVGGAASGALAAKVLVAAAIAGGGTVAVEAGRSREKPAPVPAAADAVAPAGGSAVVPIPALGAPGAPVMRATAAPAVEPEPFTPASGRRGQSPREKHAARREKGPGADHGRGNGKPALTPVGGAKAKGPKAHPPTGGPKAGGPERVAKVPRTDKAGTSGNAGNSHRPAASDKGRGSGKGRGSDKSVTPGTAGTADTTAASGKSTKSDKAATSGSSNRSDASDNSADPEPPSRPSEATPGKSPTAAEPMPPKPRG